MKPFIHKLFFLLLSWGSFQSYAQAPDTTQRGRTCWVFRSSLDGQARIITVALHPDLWAAYNGTTGALYKVWNNGVKFEGTQYNMAHGPQPTTLGRAYSIAENAPETPPYILLRNGAEVKYKAFFRGYLWQHNKVTFRTQLITPDGHTITIEESPEFTRRNKKAGYPGLIRSFRTEGIPEGTTLLLPFNLQGLPSPTDFQTNGNVELLSKTENLNTSGSTYGLMGRLQLVPNANTRFISYFKAETDP